MRATRLSLVIALFGALTQSGCGGSTDPSGDGGAQATGGGASGGGTGGGGTTATGGGTAAGGGGAAGGGVAASGGGGGGGTAVGGGGGSSLDCASCHGVASLSGAHAAHLTRGAMAVGFQCQDCHVPPTDATHQTQPVAVSFGALASTGAASPSWSSAAGTCSSVYCHGATSSGGTQPELHWDGGVDTVACGTCHGLSPDAGTHVQVGVRYCSVCHLGINSSGTVNPDAGYHVNGKADLKADAGHVDGWQPPGHSGAVNFTSCLVCHPTGRSCSSCH